MTKSVVLLLCSACLAIAATPDPAEIMRRVSENMQAAQAARANYVYDQNVFVRLKRANGKLAQEESREYTVVPTATGAKRKLVKVDGKILNSRREITYNQAGFHRKDIDIDAALVDAFAREAMWRRSSMPDMGWYAFELKDLPKYTFRFEGEERYRDYDVYRIGFIEKEDSWEGEALIERNEYQPVLITSAWTGKVPMAVTIGLGITVSQIGSKITFKRLDKDIWFPATFGGEMKLRVLFLYARTIAFSATSSGFRKADVQSSIEFDPEE